MAKSVEYVRGPARPRFRIDDHDFLQMIAGDVEGRLEGLATNGLAVVAGGTRAVRVLIVDEHPVVRDGVATQLAATATSRSWATPPTPPTRVHGNDPTSSCSTCACPTPWPWTSSHASVR
jgi:hypothetical protein